MLNTYREIALLNFISQDACGNCGFCQRNTGNILQNKKINDLFVYCKTGINGLFIIAMENGTAFKIFLPNVV